MAARLPPLNALRAFEASARLGSFVAAAAELRVSRTSTQESWRAPWSYYLVAPSAHFARPVVRAFVDWALQRLATGRGPE